MPDVHWYAKRRAGSRLQIDSGGVIDWNSGDVTLTHSANALTLAGGQLILPNGTAVAPPLAWTSSGANGFFYSGVMRWAESGVDRMAIDSAALSITSALRFAWTNSTTNSADTKDTQLARAAAGTVYLYGTSTAVGGTARLGNTNVGYEDLTRNSEAHTLAAAGTSTTATAVWPASSSSLGAAFRITTEITGCTSVQVGVAGDTTRYGTFSTLTAGQTIAIGRVDNYAAETGVLFTAVGGGASFTAGVVRVNLRYITASAPTS